MNPNTITSFSKKHLVSHFLPHNRKLIVCCRKDFSPPFQAFLVLYINIYKIYICIEFIYIEIVTIFNWISLQLVTCFHYNIPICIYVLVVWIRLLKHSQNILSQVIYPGSIPNFIFLKKQIVYAIQVSWKRK